MIGELDSKPRRLRSSLLLTTPKFEVRENTLALPSGKEIVRTMIHHPGAVVMVPVLSDGSLILLRQYRHTLDRTIIEFPAGTLNPDEDPLSAAARELREETGMTAKSLSPLGRIVPAPGICDEVLHLFLAETLDGAASAPEEDEFLEVISMSFAELRQAILIGDVIDAKTISAFFLASAALAFG